ncbi:hypothetical protein DX928_08630 [Bacillus swezeyi]|nr:hypothetical protein DX928_08630 [Bacillus swezeyi]
MTIEQMKANPLVCHNVGKAALQRGPLVYCLEEADNSGQLQNILLPRKAELVSGACREFA